MLLSLETVHCGCAQLNNLCLTELLEDYSKVKHVHVHTVHKCILCSYRLTSTIPVSSSVSVCLGQTQRSVTELHRVIHLQPDTWSGNGRRNRRERGRKGGREGGREGGGVKEGGRSEGGREGGVKEGGREGGVKEGGREEGRSEGGRERRREGEGEGKREKGT